MTRTPNQSIANGPTYVASSECSPRYPVVAYDVFSRKNTLSGFPSMSHRFPRAPFPFSLGCAIGSPQFNPGFCDARESC
jgi:hypothetical protein